MATIASKGESLHPQADNRGRQVVARFEVGYRRYLDPDGNPLGEQLELAEDGETLRALYRGMMLTRVFDKRAVAMQRVGQINTFPSSLGQEAVSVGIAAAMSRDDVLLPDFRETGAMLWRGATPAELFTLWSGDERGATTSAPAHDFPPAIPVASQCTHAVGVATAFKLRRERRVAVCMLGDGGTSKGDFYEAVNIAGAWRLPVMFVVVNNAWAISVPRASQSAAATLAQKAIAGGFVGEQVDGNDVMAVTVAATEALARIRDGAGPELIEALTYRLSDHTTADDATRYRLAAEVSSHWRDEPLVRLRAYLGRRAWWSRADEEALIKECEDLVAAGRQAYLELPPVPPTAMFDHLFATLPRSLVEQRRRFEQEAGHD